MLFVERSKISFSSLLLLLLLLRINAVLLNLKLSSFDTVVHKEQLCSFNRQWQQCCSILKVMYLQLFIWLVCAWLNYFLSISFFLAFVVCQYFFFLLFAFSNRLILLCSYCFVFVLCIPIQLTDWLWLFVHCVSKKRHLVYCPYICQILTDFQSSFTATFTEQFAIK